MNFQQILSNLFSFANSYEAIVFSIILVMTLLLGVLFTNLVFAWPKLKKKRKAIAELESNLEISNSKVKLNEDKYTVQLSKTKRLEEELAKMQVQTEDLIQKNNGFLSEISQLKFEKDALQQGAENSEKEILELKNLYNLSMHEISTSTDRFALFSSEKNEILAKLEDYKNLVEQLEKERQNVDGTSEELKKTNAELKSECERLEIEKAVLKEENFALKLQLNEKEQLYFELLKQISISKEDTLENPEKNHAASIEEEDSQSFETDEGLSENVPVIQSIEPASELSVSENEDAFFNGEKNVEEDVEDNLSLETNTAENLTMSEIFRVIGQANLLQSDNLKLINGINQDLEEKLISIGINSFEQISRLNDDVVNLKLCQLLKLKEKTIENDQWEAQARQLLIKQKINNLTRDINLNKLVKK